MSNGEDKSYHEGFKAGQQAQQVNGLSASVQDLTAKIDDLIPTVERLKVLAAGWGAFGGLCVTLVMSGIAIIVYLK